MNPSYSGMNGPSFHKIFLRLKIVTYELWKKCVSLSLSSLKKMNPSYLGMNACGPSFHTIFLRLKMIVYELWKKCVSLSLSSLKKMCRT
jgi:hypothetical protein